MLTVTLFAFVAIGYPAQVTRAQKHAYSAAFGPQNTGERDKIRAKLQPTRDQKEEEKDKFIVDFIHLPPKQRIEQWLKTPPALYGSADDALIADGVNAAPYLADIVRKANLWNRERALRVLCDMDRFVPADETPLPEVARLYLRSSNLRGLVNPFILVDGHRIGKEAFAAVQWAAEQNEDKKLRLYARFDSGLLEQDFRKLPTPELAEQWKTIVIKCNHLSLCVGKPDLEIGVYLLGELLAARVPESIPLLLDLIENGQNGFVRMGAIEVLQQADVYRARLNGFELGRHALDVMLRNLDPKNPKRFFPVGFLRPGEWRKNELKDREVSWRSAQELLADDHMTVGFQTDMTIFAHAFLRFYGERIPADYNSFSGVIEPSSTIRQFAAYLTKIDPYFPSWEYTFPSKFMSGQQVLHPRFKDKVARYYDQWKRFKADMNQERQTRESVGRITQPRTVVPRQNSGRL